ncbi:MAG: DUF3131 domain-containing protein [Candidatus Omnitrophica bacterium]|nr:DUF3131 domain-containing protein [Candidatus Omnitrophota bacterium]
MRKTPLLFILVWQFLLILHPHPAGAEPGRDADEEIFPVYKSLPDEKSLATSPQFVVIDDFNTGKLKNAREMPWQTKAPAGGAFDISLFKKDSRSSVRGYSLQVKYNLLPSEKAVLQTLLNRLDVSQAKYLSFKCRMSTSGDQEGEGYGGKLSIALTDWKHKKAYSNLVPVCTKNTEDWQEVIIPLSDFRGIDFDQIFSLQFFMGARNRREQGELYLDEIAFFGFNDTAFESNRDNLVGFPRVKLKTHRKDYIKELNEKTLLKSIAYDTWKYFKNIRDKQTALITDHIRLGDSPLAADYTSPTNIAMDLLSIISAQKLEFISYEQAVEMTDAILDTLEQLSQYKGFFYNFYDTKKLHIGRSYVSTVDSGWLAIALTVVRQAFGKEFSERVTKMIDGMDFGELLDPENNHLVVGLDVPERNFGQYHYGMLVSEARATSYFAIGKKDVPSTHWWFLYRTPPEAWRWQNQAPHEVYDEQDEVGYIKGYYQYEDKKFVPSWGGSLFEFLMPTLVLKETELASDGLGYNDRIATEIQRDYALKVKNYPVWGISPASTTNGRRWNYKEYGVKALSVKGYPDRGIITPHVSFLALETLPEDAVANIRKLLDYDLYGEYGFYDSVNVGNGKVNYQYLALDQGMSLVAITNYLTHGAIKELFHQDPIGKAGEELLMKENFSNA